MGQHTMQKRLSISSERYQNVNSTTGTLQNGRGELRTRTLNGKDAVEKVKKKRPSSDELRSVQLKYVHKSTAIWRAAGKSNVEWSKKNASNHMLDGGAPSL